MPQMCLLLALIFLGVGSSLAAIFQDLSQLPSKPYDFIIVGGGTAGLVVANRITEDPRVRVLVLEAGQSHQGILDLEVPWLASRLRLAGARFDWPVPSTPQPGLNGRSIAYSRGRVLGGSSSHNGMLYTRGSSDDYDRWAEVTGDKGWSWKKMLPYLKKSERWTTAPGHGPEEGDFDPRAHGFTGPLGIGFANVPEVTDSLVIQTTRDMPNEFPFLKDANAGRPIGAGWSQLTAANGSRCSSATAYLDPVLDRPNLSVLVGVIATRVLKVSKGHFRTVEFAQNQTSPRHQLTASKEIILSAGTIGTPQILLNSGIGDSTELQNVGIQPVHHLPSVGKNFTTQPSIRVNWRANVTIIDLSPNSTAFNEALQEWMTSRTGLLTGVGPSTYAYVRLPKNSPALMGHVDPTAGPNTPHFRFSPNANGFFTLSTDPILSVVTGLDEPASRGTVTLRSNNPFELPVLDLGFFTDPVDMAILKEGYKTAERFVTSPAWQGFTLDRIQPPPNVTTDQDIEQYIRNFAGTSHHGIGTSAMSRPNAAHGVVNPDLLVKGISGLRIVDASVIPFIPMANTQAPVYNVAERASDLIKKAWKIK